MVLQSDALRESRISTVEDSQLRKIVAAFRCHKPDGFPHRAFSSWIENHPSYLPIRSHPLSRISQLQAVFIPSSLPTDSGHLATFWAFPGCIAEMNCLVINNHFDSLSSPRNILSWHLCHHLKQHIAHLHTFNTSFIISS